MSDISLYLRGRIYYFYIRIPKDVRVHFNRQFIYKSTKTDIKSIAKKRVNALIFKAAELFERIRSGMFKEHIDMLISQFIEISLGETFLDSPLEKPDTETFEVPQEVYSKANGNAEPILIPNPITEHDFAVETYKDEIAFYDDCLMQKNYSYLGSHQYLRHIQFPKTLSARDINSMSEKITLIAKYIEQFKLDRLENVFNGEAEQLIQKQYAIGIELANEQTISQVFELMAKAKKIDRVWSNERISEKRRYLKVVLEIIGDLKINKLNAGVWQKFIADIQLYPKNRNGKRLAKYSYEQIKTMSELAKLDATSINSQYIQTIAEIYKYAQKNNYLKNANTYELIKKISTKYKENTKVEPFTDDDVVNIFFAIIKRSVNKRYKQSVIRKAWIALIAMYTGMRQLEIIQLRKNNIHMEYGVPCFDLTSFIPTESYRLKNDDERKILVKPVQLIKNEKSRRFVPIHEKLLELGLMEFVKSRKPQGLFIDSENDFAVESRLETHKSNYRTWFTKIKNMDKAFEGNKSFHSYRHSFLTKAIKNRQMSEIYINYVAGHTPTKSELVVYIESDIPIVRDVVNYVQYPIDIIQIKEQLITK